jgi:hypothetical protein
MAANRATAPTPARLIRTTDEIDVAVVFGLGAIVGGTNVLLGDSAILSSMVLVGDSNRLVVGRSSALDWIVSPSVTCLSHTPKNDVGDRSWNDLVVSEINHPDGLGSSLSLAYDQYQCCCSDRTVLGPMTAGGSLQRRLKVI